MVVYCRSSPRSSTMTEPKFVRKLTDNTVRELEKTVLECKVEATPSTPTITWQCNGKDLKVFTPCDLYVYLFFYYSRRKFSSFSLTRDFRCCLFCHVTIKAECSVIYPMKHWPWLTLDVREHFCSLGSCPLQQCSVNQWRLSAQWYHDCMIMIMLRSRDD